ncbi:MAG: ABC transporter permease [Saprospiraceae bacterium]|nr:ABC transporter permease [Saprospiraceae bacterium]
MQQFFAFVQKEVFHILRDYRTLLIIIGIPIVQILRFGFALSNEVKNTKIGILDYSSDYMSRSLVEQIEASQYFEIVEFLESTEAIAATLRKGKTKMVMVIPAHFEDDLLHQNSAQLQLITDGTNPNMATTLINYISAITMEFQGRTLGNNAMPLQIKVTNRMLYNPQLRAEFTFVPGVIALVLMLVCTMMTAVSIVKEKEMGNMETLLVSPMNPLAFIISKAGPYLMLSLLILTVILWLSSALLNVPIRGSLLLIYGVSMIFVLGALGLGLVISTLTDAQQTAMMISLTGLMLPTMMFSGFMFPIESMPVPLQLFSHLIPAKWYFYSIQAVMIKGLGVQHIWKEILILTVFTVVFLTISFKKFKTRLA